MENELQVTLDTILEDKNINLKPENLKMGVTCLGVTGILESNTPVGDIKQFQTIEEMNQSTGNEEGDLAIVYRTEMKNMTAETETQYITFPETVVLPEAFTDSIYMMIRASDDTHMFDGNAMLDQSMFRFDGYSESGMIRISYSSSDGITYTRDEFTSDSGELTNPVDLGIVIKCGMPEEWNDTFGYFMQVGGNVFEGLYECGKEIDKTKLLNVTNTTNIDMTTINMDFDTLFNQLRNIGKPTTMSTSGPFVFVLSDFEDSTPTKVRILGNWGSYFTSMVYNNSLAFLGDTNTSEKIICEYNLKTNLKTETKTTASTITINDDNWYKFLDLNDTDIVGTFSCSNDWSTWYNSSLDITRYIYENDTKSTQNISASYGYVMKYQIASNQLTATTDNVYNSIVYSKDGIIEGTLTQNVSNQFTDVNAEVYAKIQQSYDKLEPRILTDSDKTLDKNILVVPLKSDGTQLLNTSSVTDMSNLFMNCNKLQFIFALNTINATNMSNLFRNCNNLMSIPNLDTNNVTNMTNMFRDCTNIVNIPELNTNNAIDMFCMFLNCKSLTSISNLNASNVVNMYSMFSDCTNLTTVSNLNTGEVNTTRYMFSGCTNLTNISNFNTQNVLDTYCMFSGCTNITSIPYFDTSNVTNISSMFVNCYNLTSVPNLDTSNANTMANMFVNCYNLTNIPNFDTSKVTNMHRTFAFCTNLTTIPLLDTSNVVNMYSMFINCKNLTTIPNLNTSKVNSMGSMFADCTSLTTIPNLNASSLVRTYYMFENCSSLTTIPNINTSKVNNMYLMFFNCSNLIDVPVLNTSNVTTMNRMFTNCSNLSNASLNNILYMCATSKPSYTNYKKLSYIGLTEDQANICMTLSNYSLFTSKGWTTGY